jgi:hypothetical protein
LSPGPATISPLWATPAGWYPDPSGAAGQRYFDGLQWTEHRTTPHAAKSKAWIWALVGVAVLMFGGCSVLVSMISHVNSGDGHVPGTGGQRTGSSIGSTVSDGKFQFRVTDVGPLPANWYGPAPTARGQWIIATMTVSNTGNEPQSFSVQNQKLIDSAGREYAADTMASYAFNSNTTMVLDMNAGFTITVKVPFDVPPGTQAAAVEVHDSAFSGGARVTVG